MIAGMETHLSGCFGHLETPAHVGDPRFPRASQIHFVEPTREKRQPLHAQRGPVPAGEADLQMPLDFYHTTSVADA